MPLEFHPNQVRHQPLRIQLIDGDAVARRRAAEYLRAAGLEVQDAGSAAGAFVQMRQATPDVLVLDPALRWSRAVIARRAQDPDLRAVPLVLLSREANLSQAVQDLGARAGLAKAIDMDVLLAVLTRVGGYAPAAPRPRVRPVAAGCATYPARARRTRPRQPQLEAVPS
jgi:DNA-binding NarL/FixJ family response regulator